MCSEPQWQLRGNAPEPASAIREKNSVLETSWVVRTVFVAYNSFISNVRCQKLNKLLLKEKLTPAATMIFLDLSKTYGRFNW